MTGHVGIIFNNGHSGSGNQTANLTFEAGGIYHPDGSMNGIDDITSEADAPVYYNLQGQPVASPAAGTLYIERSVGKAHKVIF